MSPVGGSRHYDGRGLGEIGLWGCPSCGEDNTGPLVEGCVHCGAGRPAATPPPPPTPPIPRVSEREPDDVTYDAHQGDVADHWAEAHPEVMSIAEAYRAGYLDGIRAVRAAQPPPPPVPETPEILTTMKTHRTVIAALSLFRDQILSTEPEEIQTGEWLSAQEASQVIALLQQLMSPAERHEVSHAH